MPVYVHRFALNIAQKHLVAGLFPDPLGSLRSSPRLPSWIKGEGRGGERKGRRGKEDAIFLLSYFLAAPRVSAES